MSKKIKRRQFLAGVAAAGPALGLAATTGKAVAAQAPAQRPSIPPVPQTDRSLNDMPPQTSGKTGSDFMVDVMKTLDIDYIASCPGSLAGAVPNNRTGVASRLGFSRYGEVPLGARRVS